MNKVKVIWFSRHTMTAEQKEDLANHPVLKNGMDSSTPPADLEVVSENLQFPADGMEAAKAILAKAEIEGAEYITGVFPAHIAVCISRMIHDKRCSTHYSICVLRGAAVPVSVPAPAVEGETRGGGFVHHHWELI